MRQLLVRVPQGCGKTVLEIAKACDGTNLAKMALYPSADAAPDQVTNADLTQDIQSHLLDQGFNAMPLVNVIVLETPADKP